jgi:hypothetical protein
MLRPTLEPHRDRWRRELTTGSAWRSELPGRILDLGAAVAAAAAILDALLTYFLLGGAVHLERNPLVASVMRGIGIDAALTLGSFLRLAIVLALTYIAIHAVRPFVRYAAATTLGAVALWWTFVVFLNAAAIVRPS